MHHPAGLKALLSRGGFWKGASNIFLVNQPLSQSSVHLAYKDEQNFTLKILVTFVSWCCWWLWKKYVLTLTVALMKIPHLFKPDLAQCRIGHANLIRCPLEGWSGLKPGKVSWLPSSPPLDQRLLLCPPFVFLVPEISTG